MKKILIGLSTLLLLITLFVGMSLSAFAEDSTHSGTWGDLTWTFDESTGELTISGTGDMEGFAWYDSTSAWHSYSSKIKAIVIEFGITSIGQYAFNGCESLPRRYTNQLMLH